MFSGFSQDVPLLAIVGPVGSGKVRDSSERDMKITFCGFSQLFFNACLESSNH